MRVNCRWFPLPDLKLTAHVGAGSKRRSLGCDIGWCQISPHVANWGHALVTAVGGQKAEFGKGGSTPLDPTS